MAKNFYAMRKGGKKSDAKNSDRQNLRTTSKGRPIRRKNVMRLFSKNVRQSGNRAWRVRPVHAIG